MHVHHPPLTRPSSLAPAASSLPGSATTATMAPNHSGMHMPGRGRCTLTKICIMYASPQAEPTRPATAAIISHPPTSTSTQSHTGNQKKKKKKRKEKQTHRPMTGHLFREIPRRLALYSTRRYLADMYKWAEWDLPSTAPTPAPAPALAERGSTGRPGIHPSPPGTAQHAHSPRRRTTYWRASAERMAQADAEHAIRCASYTALRSWWWWWWWWYACRSHLHEYVVGCCCSTPPPLPMPMPMPRC